MAAYESGKIRNVAVAGHRGTGKTSLVEAMLFQAGAVNRLGPVDQATTVSDWEEEEHKRQMSLSAGICHLEWQGRKVNLIDAPGDPGFQADAIAALRVVEGVLLVVNATAGVEVQTTRVWNRCEELELSRLDLREHARPRARGLLRRARGAFAASSPTAATRSRSRSATSTS